MTSLETWRLRALSMAAALRLPISEINSTAAILANSLRSDTLQELADRIDRSLPLPVRAHPIGRFLTTPGPESIVSLTEIAAYLSEFVTDPAMPEIIGGLKGQYYSTVTQLAIAYRLKHVGASNVRLEPELPSGRRADVAALYDGVMVVTECYRPTVLGRPEHHESFLGKALLDHVSGWPQPVAVGILVRRRLDAELRQVISRTARSLLDSVRTSSFSVSEYRAEREYEVTVAPTVVVGAGEDSAFAMDPQFPRDLGEPVLFMRTGLAPRSEIERLNPKIAFPTGSCIGIWEVPRRNRLPSEPRIGLSRLLRKARKKMGQTKVADDSLRLLVLDSWVTDVLDEIPDPQQAFDSELLRHHDGDVCALCVRREWAEDIFRYVYKYRPFVRAGDSIGHRLVDALQGWEVKTTVPTRTN